MGISNQKGDIGEASFILAATKKGYWVGKMPQGCPYDYILDKGAGPIRVQVKFRTLTKTGTIQLKIINNTFTNRTTYTSDNIDVIVVYISDVDELFYIPITDIQGQIEATLRYTAPKGGNTNNMKFIKNYIDW